ncbi:MAG TPA: aldehyde dehydrogenase family protein [Gemmatimonadales bacterium]|jgi:betaine-aldehyde dehydrogenase|nr:aldehyde dehydrogenase family protein [Gemmatimonadales bacterium]
MPQPILIDGAWVPSRGSRTRDIRNPATLECIDSVTDAAAEDVDAAVRAASRAQHGWWKLPGIEKARHLHEIAAKLRAGERALSTLMARETGKPLIEAIDCIDWVAACFDYYAEVGRRSWGNSMPPVLPHQINFTVKEPYGVVAAIVPFNFPLLLMAWKVAPALMAGNTLVCKPPHQNPLSNLLMARSYDGLPPGVVNVITGGPETGEQLVEHPGVDLIAFTGSVDAGRQIAARAGAALKKINLELGSVDPLIVFADADLDAAVPGTAWARLLNAGQVCTSSKRIYVEASIAEEFTRRLIDFVKSVVVGDPMDPATDVGPLISEEALARVERQLAESVRQGATVALGGRRIQPGGLRGHYLEPTVLTGVRQGSLPTTEEIFGPVLSVTVARDADEAIALANDSRYGLGASIFTASLETAMRAMENIKAGTFWVNDPLTDNDAGPFGGMRWSGVGRELGEEGLDAFREPKHVHIDYVMERKYYWYPYRARPIPEPHG